MKVGHKRPLGMDSNLSFISPSLYLLQYFPIAPHPTIYDSSPSFSRYLRLGRRWAIEHQKETRMHDYLREQPVAIL